MALDPRLSETATKSDEWISIRPGTDLEFYLAMLKGMIERKYYDAEFLRIHTNMPFLTYKDESGRWRSVKDEQGRPMALQEGTDVAHVLPAYANTNQVDARGNVVLGKRVSRQRLLATVARLPACLIGVEACGGAHYWVQAFRVHSHEVRMMAPPFVRP